MKDSTALMVLVVRKLIFKDKIASNKSLLLPAHTLFVVPIHYSEILIKGHHTGFHSVIYDCQTDDDSWDDGYAAGFETQSNYSGINITSPYPDNVVRMEDWDLHHGKLWLETVRPQIPCSDFYSGNEKRRKNETIRYGSLPRWSI